METTNINTAEVTEVEFSGHAARTLADDQGNWLPLNWGCGAKRYEGRAGNQSVAGCGDFGEKIVVR